MGWKTIQIDAGDYIRLYLNNLYIKRESGKITINLSDIDTLLLNNNNIVLSLRLINACLRQNINIIVCNDKYEPSGYVVPISGHHMSLKILEKQMGWSNVYKGGMWKKIIQNKIDNQKAMLAKNNLSAKIIDELNFLKEDVKDFDVTNREGHAAKIYWHEQYGVGWTRTHKGAEDALNIMLNYGYTLLRGLVIRSIIKKGLDPRIALFHKSFSNFFALGSDLMEPFRPLIDHLVYQYRDAHLFTVEIRDELVKLLTTKVYINTKSYYLNNAIDICIDNIINGKGWKWVTLWE